MDEHAPAGRRPSVALLIASVAAVVTLVLGTLDRSLVEIMSGAVLLVFIAVIFQAAKRRDRM